MSAHWKTHWKKGVRTVLAASLVGALTAGTAACGLGGDDVAEAEDNTVNIGVLYPKTGQYAEYGRLFQQGLDLAVDEVNAAGGVGGKTLGLKYYDTQSDPKQDASVAPKLASDPSVIAVVGDYASPASAAASPTFQQAGLVHYGFNNSSPTFTQTGDHVWSPAIGTDAYERVYADAAAQQAKRVSVVYIENDWGKQAYGYFKEQAAKNGTQIVYESSYLPDSTDLSPILIPARDADPDLIVNIGYGPDGALVVNTLRDKLGYTGPFFGGQETAEFLDLAGDNAEGAVITGSFSAEGTKNKGAQAFVKAFKERYGNNPGNFEVTAYQAVKDLAYAANATEPTREGIQKALQTVTDFPLYQGNDTTFSFDQETRRAPGIEPILLVVKDGRFVPYEN
ncbi:ABC transporter substrate-binding protein [Bifidobacterium castoris]|uniref:ABC transporter substrate-binding protein n=1 Tax=Bifidobacterium castoris TaxID=2306972 RepID=A0A430F4U0_9BIFI|nr:ABC transporter substrate-binding protein [Bifidobacterium castoris]MDE5640573.1 ABC transporter substrate-binding protein [Bifidobacterium castoris]RSX45156.1 ABC transporter substrate-binding protein [Bifidobacterium castoris]